MTRELRRQGWTVNHKRMYRLMREDNLLCLRKRKFVVTTNSQHDLPVYPNLAGRMTLTGLDQLWVADITYIRLLREFIYLAVILDAFSRRVIGWALDRTLEDELTLKALRMALERRKPAAGLVHHSDRGFPRLHPSAPRARHPEQHVAQRKSLRQRDGRIVYENAEVRGSLSGGAP
jgi:transposase InsO family protein